MEFYCGRWYRNLNYITHQLKNMKIKIGLVDDHQLFLKSLGLMLANFKKYEVILEALNGKELQEKIRQLGSPPEIIFIDVNMPVMGGIETAAWLSANYPNIYLVALSMNDSDKTIISMIKAGCCAFLLKDIHPNELEKAIEEIRGVIEKSSRLTSRN